MSEEEIAFSRSSPIRSLPGIRIVSTGGYVPDVVVTNDDMAALGCDAEWIIQRTGIVERRHAPDGMNTSDVAYNAARRCIESAGVDPREIDLVLLGTFTPDMPVPATACNVQNRLGITGPAADVQAACAGFIYALVTASQYVATGCSKLALVIGADCNSRAVNKNDKKMYPLFGDGGGAVLLAKGSDKQGLLSYTLGADGSGEALLCRPMGGSRMPPSAEAMARDDHYLFMNGRPVFKWAVRLVVETVKDVLQHAQLSLDEIDLFVFHQANRRIIASAAEYLSIPEEKLLINIDRYGNTSAGTIPLGLDEAARDGRIEPGSRVVISGFGAGLAWGTAVWGW
jgi:3-oxoacyl-[acyl-carrier-protein] synthase-3